MKKILYLSAIILGIVSFRLAFAGETETKKPRYISLAPSTTEILFALGLDKEIVGVSTYCNYPFKAKGKEKIGDFSSPNIERILILKPDYIFATGLEQAQTIAKLKQLKLNVYVADPVNTTELLRTIEEIAKITHKETQAGILTGDIKKRIERIAILTKSMPQDKREKIFIEIWNDPLTTAGRGSFIDELITIAGGINIASDTRRPYSIFSAEEVIKRNPDCIIMAYMDKGLPIQSFRKRAGWQGIAAVKNNRIYNNIDPDTILRPGPRIAEGIEELYKRFYQ